MPNHDGALKTASLVSLITVFLSGAIMAVALVFVAPQVTRIIAQNHAILENQDKILEQESQALKNHAKMFKAFEDMLKRAEK